MDMKSVCLCVFLVFSLQFVCGQYSTTPCPGIFDFESDGQQVYGKITLRPVAPVSSLILRINFTVAAQLINNNDIGRLDAVDNDTLLQRYNQGQAISYLVHFPVTSPLPKLTALIVNGDTICYGPGDLARPNVYITTLSLQHTALEGDVGAVPVYNKFQHRPQTGPQIRPQPRPQQPIRQIPVNHIHFGEDDATAQIYIFNNIEPTWTTGNSPNYVVNNTDPFTQATQQDQPPMQQIFQSRPTNEPAFQVTSRIPVPVKPVTSMTPVYTEPLTNRPVLVTTPNPNEQPPTQPPDQPTSVADSLDRYSNTPDKTIECGTITGGNNRIPLIYNGNAYERGELPWLVAIYKFEQGSLRFVCGGTLVSDRHIVTAAHCMQRRGTLSSIKDIVVKVGVHNLNDWSDDITIIRTLQAATVHEAYNPATLQNDILMLTLDKPVNFNHYIRPACLWSGNTDLSVVVGKKGVVAGWGDQGVGGIGKQGEPHKVDIPIVSTNDCRASKSLFHELTFNTTLCAGDRQGSGPCVGDSGGGMYLLQGGKWRIRGVVSVSLRADNGDFTCNLNQYVVFTDAAQFLPWIKNILAQN